MRRKPLGDGDALQSHKTLVHHDNHSNKLGNSLCFSIALPMSKMMCGSLAGSLADGAMPVLLGLPHPFHAHGGSTGLMSHSQRAKKDDDIYD